MLPAIQEEISVQESAKENPDSNNSESQPIPDNQQSPEENATDNGNSDNQQSVTIESQLPTENERPKLKVFTPRGQKSTDNTVSTFTSFFTPSKGKTFTLADKETHREYCLSLFRRNRWMKHFQLLRHSPYRCANRVPPLNSH